MALISKGIKLFYTYGEIAGPGFSTEAVATNKYEVIGLQEIGELSALGAGTTRDKIEITTLADDRHVYTDGLIAESDSSEITFKFLFDANEFDALKIHANWEQSTIGQGNKDKLGAWSVELPDGTTFSMKATVSALKLDGAGVNAALTMTMGLTPYDTITVG